MRQNVLNFNVQDTSEQISQSPVYITRDAFKKKVNFGTSAKKGGRGAAKIPNSIDNQFGTLLDRRVVSKGHE